MPKPLTFNDFINFHLRRRSVENAFDSEITNVRIGKDQGNPGKISIEFLNTRIKNPVAIVGRPAELIHFLEITADRIKDNFLGNPNPNLPAAMQNPDQQVED